MTTHKVKGGDFQKISLVSKKCRVPYNIDVSSVVQVASKLFSFADISFFFVQLGL